MNIGETKAASVYQEPLDVDRDPINPRVKEVWFPGTHSDMFVVLFCQCLG